MDRKECYKLCVNCQNRQLDRTRGMICTLTNDYPDFDGDCELFVEDVKVAQKRAENQRDFKVKGEIDVEVLQTPVLGDLRIPQLALLVGICAVLFFTQIKIILSETDTEILGMSVYYFVSLVPTSMYFLFFGFAIQNFKFGLIAALAYSIVNYSINYSGLMQSGYISLAIILLFLSVAGALSLIVSKSLVDIKRIVLFGLIGAAIFTGFQLISSGFLDFDRIVDFLFNREEYDEKRLSLNFLDYEIEKSEFSRHVVYYKSIFLGVFKMIPVIFLLIALHNQFKMNRKWDDFTIDLGPKLHPIFFLFFVIGGYLVLILFATGSIDSTMNFFSGERVISMNIGDNFFIGLVKMFFYTATSLFAFWYYIIWFRKKTLAFFISNNLPISHLYFLSMLPVIGLFVWIFLTIKLMSSNQTEEALVKSVKVLNNKTLFAVYLTLVVLVFVLRMFNSRHPEYFVIYLFDLILFAIFFLVFYFKRLGVYASFAMRIILVYLMFYDILANPSGAPFSLSQITLWSLLFGGAFYFLIHPLIHLQYYKVYRLKQEDVE